MDDIYIKHYENFSDCPSKILESLQEYEVQNTFVLMELQKSSVEGIFAVLLDNKTNTFIFGLLATKGMIYVSKISMLTDENEAYCKSLVDHLVKDFLSKPLLIGGIHGYELELSMVIASLTEHGGINFGQKEDSWSYVIEKVKWSARSLEIRDSPETLLYKATLDDLDWVTEWTQNFINDDAGKIVVEQGLKQLCQKEIAGNNVYILSVDGIPVSMARKRRPMRDGCAIGIVFTPSEHRRKGYGGACVSMVTDDLLKAFKYVTLFVDPNRNPDNNMYTGVGYKLLTKAGRAMKV